MAKNKFYDTEIKRVVIFVECEDGTVRQVITKPGIKIMAMNFIAKMDPDEALTLGDPENVKFTVLNEKNKKDEAS